MRLSKANRTTAGENLRADLLLDILSLPPSPGLRESLSALDAEKWRQLGASAGRQQVRPAVYYHLKELALWELVPPGLQQDLHHAHLENMARNLKLYHDLRQISLWLREREIPAIVLKGAHLAQAVYPNIALREMFDLDLLVPRAQLQEAYDLLISRGYYPDPEDRHGAEQRLSSHHHLIGLKKENGPMVELHWHIEVPARWPIEEFWERAVPFPCGGAELLSFCNEDLLLHLCHHLSYQHRFEMGLRPLLDISLVVSRLGETLDWQAFFQRAERLGWQKGVTLALQVAQALLGAASPAAGPPFREAGESMAEQREAAISLVLNEMTWSLVPTNIAQLWQEKSLAAKIGLLRRRIFLSPEELASRYPVNGSTLRRYWYHLVRIRDLLAQHGWVAGRRDDFESLIRQHDSLSDWLAK